ncbi:odorant receptor 13a-like [Vespula squamosa]|uniref:Odorant receptor 13a-like n=1 Tax=Vespula squamosa TaxID=30214 RepID=A0ABD2BAL1_VESSQ
MLSRLQRGRSHEQCFKAYNYKDNERKRNKTSTEKGLSQRLFFNGKTIKGCFQGSTLDQLLEYYSQAIRYNERNLNIIKEIVCTTFFHIGSMKEKLLQNVSSSDWFSCLLIVDMTSS